MIGGNTMLLNQATIIAALQHYFETVMFADGKAPTVKSVSFNSTTGYETKDMFSVHVLSPLPGEKK